jgi:hypothetical protein
MQAEILSTGVDVSSSLESAMIGEL